MNGITTIIAYDPNEHNAVVARNQAIIELKQQVFQVGVHFGEPYKGAGKPTLLKPGAELIMARFKLWPKFIERTTVERWDTDKPIFHYRYECQLIHRETDEVWGAGIGSCNSMEDKYRWRKMSRVCPKCGKETIIKGKAEYGGGWVCYGKKGGCGAKWDDGAPEIENQPEGKAANDDVFTLVNTIDKMAQKRALVAAILVATGASAYFTQDVEDFAGYSHAVVDPDGEVIEGVVVSSSATTTTTEPPASAPAVTMPPAPPAPKSAPVQSDEFGPTVRQTWPDVSPKLLKTAIADLPMPVGGVIYPVAKAKLGYADDDAVKAALNVASLNDVSGTLEDLMNAVIIGSPVMAQGGQQPLPGTPKRPAKNAGKTAAERHGIAAGQ